MTDKKTVLSTAIQNPLSIALVIFTIVLVLIWMDYRSILKQQTPTITSDNSGLGGFAITPPNLSQPASQVPKIMDSVNSGTTAAPGLDGLISGLEDKVKADPSNVGKRILLAQTYKELGMVDKSLKTLRVLSKEFPQQDRVKLVMSAVLSHRTDTTELNEALEILKGLTSSTSDEVKQYLVQMYQGDAFVRLKNPKNALSSWNLALKTMPKEDNRYEILEKRIAELKSESDTKLESTQGG